VLAVSQQDTQDKISQNADSATVGSLKE
jgi:hypothetical protein